jgi:glycosyltransferase involved in cell wall biosynthesis
MSSMKVSLIVPVFNAEKDLPFLFSSLLAQERPFDEVVLVDNNSADRSKELCEDFRQQHKDLSVHVLDEKTPGPGAARSAGMSGSSGDIICFTDSDCVLDRDYAKNAEALFGQHGEIDMIGGVALPESPLEKREPETLAEEFSLVFWSEERSAPRPYSLDSRDDLFSGVPLYITTFNMACRKKVCETLQRFGDIRTMEDIDFWLRACAQGFRSLAACGELKVYHRNRTTVSSLAGQSFWYVYNLPWVLKRHFRGEFFLAFRMKKLARFRLLTGFIEVNPHTLFLAALAVSPGMSLLVLLLFAFHRFYSMVKRLKAAKRFSLRKAVLFCGIMEVKKISMTAGALAGSLKHKALCLM